MKKLSILLIAILISFCSFSQEQKVLIPVSVLDSIVDELTVKDGLIIELSRKDSVITVLKSTNTKQMEVVQTLKLNATQYEEIISNLEELNRIAEAEKKDKERELRRVKLRNILIIAAEAIVIILLL